VGSGGQGGEHQGGVNIAALRILADDLSGAADCAASFTGAGGPVRLHLHPPAIAGKRFALDLDTRWREADEAAREFAAAAREARAPFESGTALLYKKIDSTLRGQLAAELDAMLGALSLVRLVIVAPAFPQQGRALVGSRPFVNGRPLEGWVQGLAKALEHALEGRAEVNSLGIEALDTPGVLEDLEAVGAVPRVVVADASEDAHLASLAVAVRRLRHPPLLVGSSGFARALAGAPPRHGSISDAGGPSLIVVGSFSERARAQVGEFAGARTGMVIAVDPDGADMEREARRAAGHLGHGDNVLVHFARIPAAPARSSRAPVRSLAAAFAPVSRSCATLVLAGGDTARAFLEALEVVDLEIVGEVQPGIPVCAPLAAGGPVIVLKAGGFGDNGLLAALARP
jgi:uncharacterized protein YgbK (DUF1537 family)